MNTFINSSPQETQLFFIATDLKPKILPVSQIKMFLSNDTGSSLCHQS